VAIKVEYKNNMIIGRRGKNKDKRRREYGSEDGSKKAEKTERNERTRRGRRVKRQEEERRLRKKREIIIIILRMMRRIINIRTCAEVPSMGLQAEKSLLAATFVLQQAVPHVPLWPSG
jgi:hypothetical protein